jgi:hypothetical protein
VLLHFGIERNQRIEAGFTDFYDKVPMKYANFSQEAICRRWRARGAGRNRQARRRMWPAT